MASEPVLSVESLSVDFELSGRRRLRAVEDLSFSIARGETYGLVGESGSGKSTTARGILRLIEPSKGSVLVNGVDWTGISRRRVRRQRRHAQMVFQDPYSSLDPSMTVGQSVAEPLEVHEGLRGSELKLRVDELLERVAIPADHSRRYPAEFSGGQRQRIAIARALALRPSLVICDEAVSALDVSTQSSVVELLNDLKSDFDVSYLFIAHDLAVVSLIADRVGVMYLGRLVEEGPAERIFSEPAHPYTKALVSAVPVPDPVVQRSRRRIVIDGERPDATARVVGCPFRSRCQWAMDICAVEAPPAVSLPGGGWVTCHMYPAGIPDPMSKRTDETSMSRENCSTITQVGEPQYVRKPRHL